MFNEKKINIRQATVKDKLKIAKLHYTLWKLITSNSSGTLNRLTFSFFIDKWENWLIEKNKITLLAEKNNSLLGFISFEIQGSNYPDIQFVYVADKYRFSNLQKMLCDATFKMVSDKGFSKIYFSFAKENKSDLILYKLMEGYTGEEKIIKQIFGFEFFEIRYEFNLR